MRLSEFKKVGENYTGKASDIVRQLIFAGIAIIWVFKNKQEGQDTLDPFLIIPLLFLCLALIADLFQYIYGGHVWGKYYREQEAIAIKEYKLDNTKPIDPDHKAPKNKSKPIRALYTLKIWLTCIAFTFIIYFLIRHINFKS
jgi:hypothetical protein